MSFYLHLREKHSDPVVIDDNNGNIITITPAGDMTIGGFIPPGILQAAEALSDVVKEFGTVGKEPSDAAVKLLKVLGEM